MSARRPYKRPMAGWWRRNPYFIEYMVHEVTAIFVALYALILLVSIVQLASGEAAWNQWAAVLRRPGSVMLHVGILIAFLYHTWTWFNIMPRTLPPIMIGGKRLAAKTITVAGLATALMSSLIFFAVTHWIGK